MEQVEMENLPCTVGNSHAVEETIARDKMHGRRAGKAKPVSYHLVRNSPDI